MAIASLSDWADSYDSTFKAAFKTATDAASSLSSSQQAWRDWIFKNTTGLASTLPVAPTSATFSIGAFNPLPFGPGTDAALILANAWKSYMLAATWLVIPPPPGFLSVATISTSPIGMAVAFPILLAGLTAEFKIVPPPTGFAQKTKNIATLFRQATISVGAQIVGLAPGAPPPPLILEVPIG